MDKDVAFSAFEMRDERMSLEPRSRDWLIDISKVGILAWGPKRVAPPELVALINQGLVFRSSIGLSLTNKGEEVLDRIT